MGAAHLGAMHLDNVRLGGNIMNRERNAGPSLSTFEGMLRNATSPNVPEAELPPVDVPLSASPTPIAAPELSRNTPRGVTIDRDSELFQQCLELEIFLVKTLINSMRSTIQRSGLIEQSFAGEMYEDMLFDEYARHLAQNAGFGLAELAYLELTGQRGRVVLR